MSTLQKIKQGAWDILGVRVLMVVCGCLLHLKMSRGVGGMRIVEITSHRTSRTLQVLGILLRVTSKWWSRGVP